MTTFDNSGLPDCTEDFIIFERVPQPKGRSKTVKYQLQRINNNRESPLAMAKFIKESQNFSDGSISLDVKASNTCTAI